ncbi:MAG: 1-acyl-sn-glycerol-3-phosphate acyltransferase [Lachnospiraceae bacterium]|nr:1-acyl-sn-glycerol-3-phosphate acyltransferase [Lachnospiraceae bacterium]
MLRFILIVTALVLYLIIGIPVLLIEKLVARFSPRARDISCMYMVQAIFRVMLWLSGADVRYIGLENIPEDHAALYVGNHNSYFDIHLTYVKFRRPTGYVAKFWLLKIPLLRDWMTRIGCLFLDRDDIRQGMKTILTGIECLRNGFSLCIFPEGTRSKDGKMLPFHEGSMKLATRSGCPIIPIAISGSAGIWERQFPRVRPTHVIVEFGEPIYPESLSKEERKFLGAYTRDRIQQMLDRHHLIQEEK